MPQRASAPQPEATMHGATRGAQTQRVEPLASAQEPSVQVARQSPRPFSLQAQALCRQA
jgi:hypothetical protein